MIKQKNTPIPLFKPAVATTTDVDHPEGQTFYDNKIETVSPAYDAVMQGSNHVWLNGTDQSVDLPTVASGYATYFDVDTKVFVTTAITDGTPLTQTTSFSSYFTTDVPVTEADRSYLNTNPEALYAMWFGDPVVGLSFSKANMINFVPGTEGLQGGGYLQDLSVDLGADVLNTTAPTVVNSDEIGTFTGYVGNAFDLSVTTAGTNTANPRVATGATTPTVVGNIYTVTIDIVVNSGDCILTRLNVGNTAVNYNYAFTTGQHKFLIKTTEVYSNLFRIHFDGTATFDCNVTEWEIQEATAYEIANYLDTCRTTLANTNYGASNFALLQDASGRVTGMGLANTQNFPPYDDGRYASTGWKPSTPTYSIEETITGELQDFGSELQDTINEASEWVAYGTSLIEQDGDAVKVTYVDDSRGGYTFLRASNGLTVDLVLGNTYTVNCTIKTEVGNVAWAINDGISDTTSAINSFEWVSQSIIFTVVGTSPFIKFSGMGAGKIVYIKDISVKELTTKTQRTEQRLLTHTNDLIGPEIFAGAALDTQADFDEFTVNTSGQYSFDEPTGEVSHNAPGFETYLYAPITGLVVDATYEVSSDATITAGHPHYTMNGVDVTGEDLGATARFVAIAPSGNFGVHDVVGDGIFTFRTLSIKRVSAEDKYNIDGIEQAVTPALPDPAVIMSLNRVAKIGYADTIQSRDSEFNVHTEIITPTFVTTGPNLYPNWELINGSHINQDIPTGTLPDGHVLAFNTGDPCNATYNDNGDGSFSYLFNQVQDPARLVLQQTIGYGVFEVGKRYRYQAKVRTVTFSPIATRLRAIHIAAAVDLVIIDADNAMIDEEVGYELKWIDFEVTDSGISRANFRHGCGVWDVLTTAQETIELAIYELTTV